MSRATGPSGGGPRPRPRTAISVRLRGALDARVVTEQAAGVVAESHQLGLVEAFALLRSHARSKHLRLSDVARAVIDRSLAPADLQLGPTARLEVVGASVGRSRPATSSPSAVPGDLKTRSADPRVLPTVDHTVVRKIDNVLWSHWARRPVDITLRNNPACKAPNRSRYHSDRPGDLRRSPSSDNPSARRPPIGAPPLPAAMFHVSRRGRKRPGVPPRPKSEKRQRGNLSLGTLCPGAGTEPGVLSNWESGSSGF